MDRESRSRPVAKAGSEAHSNGGRGAGVRIPRRHRPGPDPAWWCPQRLGCYASAAIAEQSAKLGSLAAVYEQRAADRAAAKALAEARRDSYLAAVEQLSWTAEQRRRFKAWRAVPLQIPEWVSAP
jgi:hypothetical protein